MIFGEPTFFVCAKREYHFAFALFSRAAYVRDLRRRDLQHHARKLHGVEHLVRARPCRGVPAGAEPQLVALAVASVPVPECTSGNLGGPRAVVGAEPESSEIYDERFPSLV